jgi:NitT/TauT family transport system substrate-binding protein
MVVTRGKRGILTAGVFVALWFSGVLIFHPKVDAAELFPMKISTSNWVGYGAVWLAKALGYYEEEGLDVELVRIEEKIAQFSSLAANRIQGLCTASATFLSYWKPEYPVKLVAPLGASLGGDGIIVGPGVKTWKDFKKKKIAVSYYSSMHMVTYYMIERAGLDPKKDVEWVDMPAGDAASAFAAKKVDICVTWEPHMTKVLDTRKDARIFFHSGMPECPPLSGDYLAFNSDYVNKNRKEAKACVRAIMRAKEYADKDERKACEIMANTMGGWLKDPVLFQKLYQVAGTKNLENAYYTFTQGANKLEYKKLGLTTPAESVFEVVLFFGKALLKQGQLKEFPPIEKMIDSTIIRELKEEGLNVKK